MNSFWICFGVYAVGCFFTIVFFLVGRSPALDKGNWTWPVIFLWPLLMLWLVHALFIKRMTDKSE